MNLRRIISEVLITVILLGLIPMANAADINNTILFYDDFEGYDGRSLISYSDKGWTSDNFLHDGTWSTQHRNYLRIKEEGDNHFLWLGSQSGKLNNKGSLYKNITMPDSCVIDLYLNNQNINGIKRISLKNSSGEVNIGYIRENAFYSVDTQERLAVLQTGEWHRLTYIIDKAARTVEVYLNETAVSSGVLYIPQDISITDSMQFTLAVDGDTASGKCSDIYFDNIRITSANEPYSEAVWNGYTGPQYYSYAGTETQLLNDSGNIHAAEEILKNGVAFCVGADKMYTSDGIKACDKPYMENEKYYINTEDVYRGLGMPYTKSQGEYADAMDIAKTVGKELFVYDRQTVLFLEKNHSVNSKADSAALGTIKRSIIFPEIKADDIKKNIAGSKKDHPYIHADQEQFDKLRELIESNENVSKWVEYIRKQADQYVAMPLVKFDYRDDIRFNYAAEDSEAIITTTALIYKLTGEEQYLNRAKAEMLNGVRFPTWQPQVFLATSIMATGVALGYDWLYDELSPEERVEIEEGLLDLCIKPALEGYKDPSLKYNMATHWVKGAHNWNSVCNSGVLTAAMAIKDKYPDIVPETAACALKSLQYYIPEYFPDGGSNEGVGYWDYAIKHMVKGLSAIRSAIGTDYDYPLVKGLDTTIYFPICLAGKYSFSFHDSGYSLINPMETMYFAQRFSNNELGAYRVSQLISGKFTPYIYDLLWFDESYLTGNGKIDLPLDKYFGYVETGSMRSSWLDQNATVLFYHAGENNVAHTQMDAGAFELEMLGERFIWDTGRDNATYVPTGESYGRYDLYKYRAEGNNVVVINPDKSGGQQISAWNPIIKTQSKDKGAFAVADLKNAYLPYVESYIRGYKLSDDRKTATIQDEIKLKKPEKVFWSVHTKADIEIEPDGKSAVLTTKRKKVKAVLNSNVPGAVFTKMKAEPLSTSPVVNTQDKITDMTKLCVLTEGAEDVVISVSFIPFEDGKEPDSIPNDITAVAEWSFMDNEPNLYENIEADCKPIELLSQDFENGQTAGDLFAAEGTGLYESTEGCYLISEEKGNKYLKLVSGNGIEQQICSADICMNGIVNVKFKIKNTSGRSKVYLRYNNEMELLLAQFSDTQLTQSNGILADSYDRERWYNFNVQINVPERVFTTYVDGEVLAKNTKIPDHISDELLNGNTVSLRIQTQNDGDEESECSVDDIYMSASKTYSAPKSIFDIFGDSVDGVEVNDGVLRRELPFSVLKANVDSWQIVDLSEVGGRTTKALQIQATKARPVFHLTSSKIDNQISLTPFDLAGKYELSFDFYMQGCAEGDSIYAQFMGANWLPINFRYSENGCTAVRGAAPRNTVVDGTPGFEPGKWNTARYVIDYATGINEVWLNGEKIASGKNSGTALESVKLDQFRFSLINTENDADLNDRRVYLDNLRVIGSDRVWINTDFEHHSLTGNVLLRNDNEIAVIEKGANVQLTDDKMAGGSGKILNIGDEEFVIDLHSKGMESKSKWYFSMDFYLKDLAAGDTIYTELLPNGIPFRLTYTDGKLSPMDGSAAGVAVNGDVSVDMGIWSKLIYEFDYDKNTFIIYIYDNINGTRQIASSSDIMRYPGMESTITTNIKISFLPGGSSQNRVIHLGNMLLKRGGVEIDSAKISGENIIGQTLAADYAIKDNVFRGSKQSEGLVEWYISDRIGGTYRKLADGASLTLEGRAKNKWIKAVIMPINQFGIAGIEYETDPVYVMSGNGVDTYSYYSPDGTKNISKYFSPAGKPFLHINVSYDEDVLSSIDVTDVVPDAEGVTVESAIAAGKVNKIMRWDSIAGMKPVAAFSVAE